MKMDLALNNLQRSICHKTQTNKEYLLPNVRPSTLISRLILNKLFQVISKKKKTVNLIPWHVYAYDHRD